MTTLAEHNVFADSVDEAEALLLKTIEVGKRKSLEEAGIDLKYMEVFGEIAEHVDRDQRYRLRRYPFIAGDAASAFVGGFFDYDVLRL